MDNVSEGVDTFSTTGNRRGVTGEAAAALGSKTLLDAPIYDGSAVAGGTGETSIYITVDKNHPLVSTLTRLTWGWICFQQLETVMELLLKVL